jgi:hypothetical protein
MGPRVDRQFTHLLLRPFQTSTTYQNLKRTGEGVFHITDDVLLIAKAAVGRLLPVPALEPAPHVAGFVVREVSPVVSNWRADLTLGAYLEENGIPGIEGIDTRSLTKRLRLTGASGIPLRDRRGPDAEAVERARQWEGLLGWTA